MEALVFVNLGPTNGGLPSNARKEGPAFQAMKRLAIDQKLSVIFKLAGIDGWLRSTAKVVWLSHSGTAGGLQLVDMPAESRRVVDMWFSTQGQAGSQTPPSSTVAPPASADLGLESYQVVLPVEAIEIAPGPAQRSQPLAHVAIQANARAAAAPGIEANLGTGVAVPQYRGPAHAPEAARAGEPRKSFKIERKTAKSVALVLATLLGIFFLGGVIIAEFRSGLPTRSAGAELAPPAVPAAPVAAPLPPVDASPDSHVAPSSKPVVAPEPAPTAPEAAAQDTRRSVKAAKPASVAASSAPARVPSQPEGSAPAASQKIARPAAPSAAILAAGSVRPAPIAVPPPAATSATVAATTSTTPVSERPVVNPAPVAVAEKTPSPAVAPAASPESPTGTVEIITDPYPSIRAPVEPNARESRPAALSIGRLVSRVEPVYPPDALRQRIAGTVKLHIIRGVGGQVETATVTDGPMQLRNAALQAVQQWRYQPTLLGSTPAEAEEDVTLIFRIAASPPGN